MQLMNLMHDKIQKIMITLGLLEVTNGQMQIDGKKIDSNNIRSWQRNIGYVPQHIYLSDKSISNNIALEKSK